MTNRVWGAVLYSNTLGIVPELFLGYVVFGEGKELAEANITTTAMFMIIVSCFIGTLISYAGFNCRNLMSAGGFTLVGVVNKMVTVLINTLMWDKHASMVGTGFLMLCIVGGALYKEPPMRETKQKYDKVPPEASKEEEQLQGLTDSDLEAQFTVDDEDVVLDENENMDPKEGKA